MCREFVRGQLHAHERHRAASQRSRIDQGDIFGNDPSMLELLDSLEEWRRRQPDGLSQGGVRHPAVFLEQSQHAPVDRVEW